MADPGRLKIREGGVWRYAGVGMSGASGYSGAGSSASGYQKDFTYADLVSGIFRLTMVCLLRII